MSENLDRGNCKNYLNFKSPTESTTSQDYIICFLSKQRELYFVTFTFTLDCTKNVISLQLDKNKITKMTVNREQVPGSEKKDEIEIY